EVFPELMAPGYAGSISASIRIEHPLLPAAATGAFPTTSGGWNSSVFVPPELHLRTLVVLALNPRTSFFFTVMLRPVNFCTWVVWPLVLLVYCSTGPFAVIFPFPVSPDTLDRNPPTGVNVPEGPAISQICLMVPLEGAFRCPLGLPTWLVTIIHVHAAVERSGSSCWQLCGGFELSGKTLEVRSSPNFTSAFEWWRLADAGAAMYASVATPTTSASTTMRVRLMGSSLPRKRTFAEHKTETGEPLGASRSGGAS